MEQGTAAESSSKDDTINQTETKVIYHIDEEDTPYMVKIPKPSDSVTLADFKAILPTHLHKFKYFFKAKDEDFGVVKEEIIDDDTPLPLFGARVVSWLVAAEGSMIGGSEVSVVMGSNKGSNNE
jgi:hypothetical protein